MTEQELKIEAKKLGYTVSKKREYVKLLPCSECGSKKIVRLLEMGRKQFYRCGTCGKSSEAVEYNYAARKAWNNANS